MTATKSCLGCPSYLAANDPEILNRVPKQPGGPMCAVFGHIIGSAKSTPDEIEQTSMYLASSCPAYGLPRPAEVDWNNWIGPVVAYPSHQTQPAEPDSSVMSCNNCKHCIASPETVYKELGWVVPLCQVYGKLILKPVAEARDCVYKESGFQDQTTSHVNLVEWLRDGFRMPEEELLRQFIPQGHDIIDPAVYPTDAPVSNEDVAAGVRAWRRIFDPDGSGKYVDLPIMAASHYSDEQRLRIPQTGDETHPELYIDYNNLLWQFAVEGWALRETPILEGEPGVGKTQFARYLAWLCQMPFRRIQFQRTMDVIDLLGSDQLRDGETFFEPGVLPTTWVADEVTLLDEPNVGPDEAWQVLRPVTDNSKELVIGLQHFPRARFNLLLMAMNPSWDPRNLGTNELADADGNRLSFLLVERPPDPVERHIIRSYCKELDDYDISDETIDVILAASADIRAMSESGEYPGSWATRQMIKVARKTKWYSIPKAFRVAALDNLEPSIKESILKLVSSHVDGGEVDVAPPF